MKRSATIFLLPALFTGFAYAQSEPLIVPPKLAESVEAEYPAEARGSQTEGIVQIRLTVDVTGAPTDPQVIRSLGPAFDQAALDAVLKWRYEPGRVRGKPAAIAALATVEFHLPTAEESHPEPPPAPEVSATPPPPTRTEPAAEPEPEPEAAKEPEPEVAKKEEAVTPPPQAVFAGATSYTDHFGIYGADRPDFLVHLEQARILFQFLSSGKQELPVEIRVADYDDFPCPPRAAGCYTGTRDGRHRIIVRRQSIKRWDTVAHLVIHEFAHAVQHENGYEYAPPWLKEGQAEYMSTVKVKDDKVWAGYVPDKKHEKRKLPGAWLSLSKILLAGREYGEMGDIDAFYFQSHLLYHMLRHKEKYRHECEAFIAEVKTGSVRSDRAFEHIYGVSLEELDNDLIEWFDSGNHRLSQYITVDLPDTVEVYTADGRKVQVKKKGKGMWRNVYDTYRKIPVGIPIPIP